MIDVQDNPNIQKIVHIAVNKVDVQGSEEENVVTVRKKVEDDWDIQIGIGHLKEVIWKDYWRVMWKNIRIEIKIFLDMKNISKVKEGQGIIV